MRRLVGAGTLWVLAHAASAGPAEAARRPNVLLISLDDQNDWVGPLGGHPHARTPCLDALAARGATFLNAHCQAPLCNPSRTSVLLGLRPAATGIYGLAPWFRTVDALRDRVSLPQYFRGHGYRTAAAGKVYHPFDDPRQLDEEFPERGPAGGFEPRPPRKLIPPVPQGDHPLMDWGCFPHRDDEKTDYGVANWAIEQLRQGPRDRPFFLAVGFSLPHVPCYAPPNWCDLYPDDDRLLPPVVDDDRGDTPRFSWYLHWRVPEPRLTWLRDAGQWRNLVRSYLACTSFVDAQIGRVLTALEAEGLADDTVVAVWSDHGWHLGEKQITGKNTLWERSTRVPLLFAGPGVPPGAACREPAELLDLYPTLAALCGLPEPDGLQGQSLLPQIRDPQAPRSRPAITTHNPGNHAVRSRRWRWIRYADGSEELYDHRSDPHEVRNRADDPTLAGVREEHRRFLPAHEAPPVAGSRGRVLAYDAATGQATWEGEPIDRDAPPPE